MERNQPVAQCRSWERVPVRTPSGPAEAVAPVIVSASRATDIPARYSGWLLNRLRAGWCVRVNRFNGRREHVSFERTRVIVFWSKDPAPLLPRLGEIDALGFNYYFTFTLNDYEREGLEPGIPPLAARIATFRRLSELVGPERVVWRFDPIVVGRDLTAEAVLERIGRIGEAVHRHSRKLVVSFADIARYPAARRRLAASVRGGFAEPGPEEIARIAAGLRELNRAWGLGIAACAEAVDLSPYGIGPNRCVDDELMARTFSGDAALMEFLGRGVGAGPRVPVNAPWRTAHPLKDPGQRPACGCILSKDIGRYGTCPHGCVYCYANVDKPTALGRYRKHEPGSAFLGYSAARSHPWLEALKPSLDAQQHPDAKNLDQPLLF